MDSVLDNYVRDNKVIGDALGRLANRYGQNITGAIVRADECERLRVPENTMIICYHDTRRILALVLPDGDTILAPGIDP